MFFDSPSEPPAPTPSPKPSTDLRDIALRNDAGRPRVLIVDDSRTVRARVIRELNDEAYEVFEATSGERALEMVRQGLFPDLITLDLEMAGMDGFATCRTLFSEDFVKSLPLGSRKRTPILFLTASDNPENRKTGFDLGALDFLRKDFKEGELARAVARILKIGDELKGAQALLVDDSPTVLQAVGTGLRSAGATVIESRDGVAAYEVICNRMNELDILVTDLEMPGHDGFELCRRVRGELGLLDLPIIVLSAHNNQAQRLEAFRCGASDYLVKPFTKEEMIARLRAHIDRRRFERRTQELVKQLQVNLKVKEEMIAALSHDMRTPLNGVLGFTDLLLAETSLSTDAQEHCRHIKDSGQLLLRLIENVLALSRDKAPELERVPLKLSQILVQSMRALHPLATRKTLQVSFENEADDDVILGHQDALLRVANNLLGNAIKFTPRGGKIFVHLSRSEPGGLLLKFIDSGVGMSPHRLARLFERFDREATSGTAGEAGTGLGLNIVKQLIQQHGGIVVAKSELGRGTEVWVTLPSHASQPPPPALILSKAEVSAAPKRREENAPLAGLKVLVADDDRSSRRLVEITLTKLGCAVTTVSSGTEAVKACDAASNFDLVVLDVEMPEMDGRAVARVIRSRRGANLPILAVTGQTQPREHDLLLSAGINQVLTKPVSQTQLLAAFEAALGVHTV